MATIGKSARRPQHQRSNMWKWIQCYLFGHAWYYNRTFGPTKRECMTCGKRQALVYYSNRIGEWQHLDNVGGDTL